jgi:hypothetical protein
MDLEPGPTDRPAYTYKPSLMGAAGNSPGADTLECAGRHRGRSYAGIARVRLSYRPMQTRRFVAEISPAGGPKLSIA